MIEPLHYEPMAGGKILLYECQHVTDKRYPALFGFPVGDEHHIVLCKHCFYHWQGLMAQELLKQIVRDATMEEREGALSVVVDALKGIPKSDGFRMGDVVRAR